MPARLPKAAAATLLGLGLFALAASDELLAANREKEADQALKTLKVSKDPKARAVALTDLGKLGQIQKSLAEPAIPDMMKALDDKEPAVRAAAASAIGMVDPDPKEVVPLLVKLLKEDKSEEVRVGAANGLGHMGPNAKAAAKDLKEVKTAEEKDDGKNKKKMLSKVGRAAQDAMRSINMKRGE